MTTAPPGIQSTSGAGRFKITHGEAGSGIIAGLGVTLASRFIPEDWRRARASGAVAGVLMIAQFPINAAIKYAPHDAPVLRPAWILVECLFVAAVVVWCLLYLIPSLWRFLPSRLSPTIPLADAAAYLFGESRETLSVELAERFASDPSLEDMLDMMGNTILQYVNVRVRRLPSRKWEDFPRARLSQMNVSHGATGMRKHADSELYFIESDLARVVAKVKKLNAQVNQVLKPAR